MYVSAYNWGFLRLKRFKCLFEDIFLQKQNIEPFSNLHFWFPNVIDDHLKLRELLGDGRHVAERARNDVKIKRNFKFLQNFEAFLNVLSI